MKKNIVIPIFIFVVQGFLANHANAAKEDKADKEPKCKGTVTEYVDPHTKEPIPGVTEDPKDPCKSYAKTTTTEAHHSVYGCYTSVEIFILIVKQDKIDGVCYTSLNQHTTRSFRIHHFNYKPRPVLYHVVDKKFEQTVTKLKSGNLNVDEQSYLVGDVEFVTFDNDGNELVLSRSINRIYFASNSFWG